MSFVSTIVLFLTWVTGQFPIAECQKYEIEFGSYAYVDVFDDVAVIDTVSGVSFEACKKLCSDRYDCWTLNYHVTAHICYNTRDYTLTTSVFEVERRPNFISAHKIQDVPEWDYDYTPSDGGNKTTNLTSSSYSRNQRPSIQENFKPNSSCGYLPYVDQAHKLGNMRSVGSKVKYVCDEMEDKTDVIQCLADYKWSMTSLSCDKDNECANIHTWGTCYRMTSMMMNWDAVKYECEMVGGHLADITDEYEMQHVIEYLKSLTVWLGKTKIFIGLNNRNNMSEFRRMNDNMATYFYGNDSGFVPFSPPPQTTALTTSNEDKVSTTMWPVASTYSGTEYDTSGRGYKGCVTMVLENDLKWVKTDCEEQHASLCEAEDDCDKMPCYWFEENRTPWTKAKRNCESSKGHLADITNEEEMRLVSEFLDTFTILDTTPNIYIGINNRENLTEYRTMNGTVATYFNWLTESTTKQTTQYPPGGVNYGVYQGFLYTSIGNGSADENDGSSDENGGSASQPTLITSSTTGGVEPDQKGSFKSTAAQERCVAIDLEAEYTWVTVDCNELLNGLCEIEDYYTYAL